MKKVRFYVKGIVEFKDGTTKALGTYEFLQPGKLQITACESLPDSLAEFVTENHDKWAECLWKECNWSTVSFYGDGDIIVTLVVEDDNMKQIVAGTLEEFGTKFTGDWYDPDDMVSMMISVDETVREFTKIMQR